MKSGRPTGFLDASDAVTTLRLSDKECTTGHPRSPPVTVRHQIVTRRRDGGQLDGRPLEIALGDVRIPPGHGFCLVARHPCGPSAPSQPSGRLRCARGCGLAPRSAARSRIDSVRDELNRTTSAGSIGSRRHSSAGGASSRMAGRTIALNAWRECDRAQLKTPSRSLPSPVTGARSARRLLRE